jgi:hypothetical protein
LSDKSPTSFTQPDVPLSRKSRVPSILLVAHFDSPSALPTPSNIDVLWIPQADRRAAAKCTASSLEELGALIQRLRYIGGTAHLLHIHCAGIQGHVARLLRYASLMAYHGSHDHVATSPSHAV